MNARNLQYIKKFNPRKSIRLADNKFRTKTFLWERWIPVPATYDVIKSRKELYEYDFGTLPVDEFIVKPNKWSRWRGIYRVKRLDESIDTSLLPFKSLWRLEQMFGEKKSQHEYSYKVSWEVWSENFFKRHLLDIVDGKNSLTQWHDSILLEELLIPWNGFETFCEHWLADIRVIVFNLIPVAAMLRVPTEESEWKANLDRWALWFWLNISTWKVNSLYKKWKIYRTHFPEEFSHFQWKKISYRDDILLYSSKIQYFANLWYLALDRVLTEQGPKILEINARAWLKFQLAAILPLRKRLEKIKELKITSPEKWVEITKSLFNEYKWHVISSSKVVYLTQHGRIQYEKDESTFSEDVLVDVDLKRSKALVSQELASKIASSNWVYSLILDETHITFKKFSYDISEKTDETKIVLWKNLVQDYYVKPIKKVFTRSNTIPSSSLYPWERDELHILDEKILNLWKKLNLSRILKPTNYLDQLDLFIEKNGVYNPQFEYKRPSDQLLHEIHTKLDKIEKKYFWQSPKFQSPFAQLFLDKIWELRRKHALLIAYKQQDADAILAANINLYGTLDQDNLALAKELVFEHTNNNELLWPFLTSGEVRAKIKKKLLDVWVKWVRIVYDSEMTSRMSVVRGKTITIKIAQWTQFREIDLDATLEHEIWVHIVRRMAWRDSGWHILRNGTADFIVDEEGLAVWKSLQVLPESYQRMWRYIRYYLLSRAWSLDFIWLWRTVSSLKWNPLRKVFMDVLRMKKWIEDTSKIWPWMVYYKDKVYLDGQKKLESRIEQWWNIDDLKYGKIKIEDSSYFVS